MIGVPGTSAAARTSSESWFSTLRSVKVPATAGVRSHWAAGEVQSADSSISTAGFPNTLVGPPRRKQPLSALKLKRPDAGTAQTEPAPTTGSSVPSPASSATTASTGVVPQPRAKSAQITPVREHFSAVGFWPDTPSICWLTPSNVMSFATLACVANVVPSSFVTPHAAGSAEAALELHEAIIRNEAGWQRRAFDAFHGLVHGLLIKSLGPRAEIADLVGDAFVIFFGSAHRIQSALAVRSYLVSITMNLARREVRQRKRRELFQRFTGGAPEYEQEPGQDDPKAKAALIQLSRILDELSADERAAFVLSNLEGLALLEIAQALGVSESTAKRRVRRANEHVLKRVSRNALLADYVQVRTERQHG
jgi:RNA polymerase sigma-70 factor (ECF subfamily)